MRCWLPWSLYVDQTDLKLTEILSLCLQSSGIKGATIIPNLSFFLVCYIIQASLQFTTFLTFDTLAKTQIYLPYGWAIVFLDVIHSWECGPHWSYGPVVKLSPSPHKGPVLFLSITGGNHTHKKKEACCTCAVGYYLPVKHVICYNTEPQGERTSLPIRPVIGRYT